MTLGKDCTELQVQSRQGESDGWGSLTVSGPTEIIIINYVQSKTLRGSLVCFRWQFTGAARGTVPVW